MTNLYAQICSCRGHKSAMVRALLCPKQEQNKSISICNFIYPRYV